MKWYKRLRLRGKIIFMMMLVSFTVLCITNVLYVSRMIPSLKESMVNEYSNYAQLIGNSVIGSLLFSDTETANEILSPLVNQESIVGAVIYNDDVTYFAGYGSDANSGGLFLENRAKPLFELYVEYTFLQNNLVIISPIFYDKTLIGYIYLEADVTARNAEFYWQVLLSIVTFLLSLVLAYVLANILQNVVTDPVNSIVMLMNQVSGSKDFSLRATLKNDDELGRLGDGFNDMLSRIESRDLELNEYKASLEAKVEERTLQLNQATDEANAATEAKSDFLAKMSHEIRTPLNAIIGFSKLTLRAELKNKQRENLTKILDSSETLLGLINDILDFSKIEAGKLELENVEFRLDKVIQRSMGVIGLRAYEKNLELINFISHDVPRYLIGDSLRLQQIITNLSTNAVKFTNTGSVSVMISRVNSESGAKLKIAVGDTGVGISQEQQDKLFQSFSQADNSVTRKYGGTGLGLSICKQLCELMGGNITVSSEQGVGSTFTFTVLLRESNRPEIEANHVSTLSELNILIVDDNELSRKVICESLKRVARNIDTANDGLEALNRVQSALDQNVVYDLIIMDWKMPNMDGLEAAKIIRRDLGQNTPEILMVSAFDKEEVMPEANKLGLTHFLEKPFTASSLVDYLGEMLDGVEPVNEIHESSLKAPDLRGNHILLVEDNKLNQQVAAGFLYEMNLQVDFANNGVEAIEKLSNKHSYDLVLMDIQMPVLDGLTATTKIRDDLKLDLPIVAMTAHAMDEDSRKSKAAGMDEHLSKPIELRELYRVLTAYLKVRPEAGAVEHIIEAAPKLNENVTAEHRNQPYLVSQNSFVQTLSSMPELNIKHSLTLLNGNTKMLEEFVYEFVPNNELCTELKDALAKPDIDKINLISHTLKNQLSYLGALELRDLANELEAISKLTSSKPTSVNSEIVLQIAQTLLLKLDSLVVKLSAAIPARSKDFHRFEKGKTNELIGLLIAKLLANDDTAEGIAAELGNFCRDTDFEDKAKQIIVNTAALKFDEALKETRKLSQQIKNQ